MTSSAPPSVISRTRPCTTAYGHNPWPEYSFAWKERTTFAQWQQAPVPQGQALPRAGRTRANCPTEPQPPRPSRMADLQKRNRSRSRFGPSRSYSRIFEVSSFSRPLLPQASARFCRIYSDHLCHNAKSKTSTWAGSFNVDVVNGRNPCDDFHEKVAPILHLVTRQFYRPRCAI